MFLWAHLWGSSTGFIIGSVTDSETGDALAGVNIIVDGTRYGAAADAQGQFIIENIPVGQYRINVRMVGYKVRILRQVNVAAELSTELQIVLDAVPIELGAVTVTRGKINDPDEELSPSHHKFDPREVRSLAGGGDDLFRSITTMPGVVARSDASAQFYVRGGTPDQNLIIIDDVPVFNPYRLKALGGPISMFNTDVLEYVELLPGGFPAQYGDKLSSVLIARNREGDRFEPHGKVGGSLLDMKILAEGPLPGSGEEGSWIVSGRRTYYDILLDKLANLPEGTVFPNYRDLQGKIVYDLSPEQKLRINMTDSREEMVLADLEVEGEAADDELFAGADFFTLSNFIDSRLYSVGWMNAISDVALSNLTLSRYNDTWTMELEVGDNFYRPVTDMRKMEIREDLTYILSSDHTLQAGLEVADLIADIAVEFAVDSASHYESDPDDRREGDGAIVERSIRLQNASSSTGFYLQDDWQLLAPILMVRLGARADYSTFTDAWVYSPRLSFIYNATEAINLRFGWGHYYQAPNFGSLFERFERNIEWNLFETIKLKTERAEHVILGVEVNPKPSLTFKIEAYYKDLTDLIVPGDSSSNFIPENDGSGYARGVELFLQRRAITAKSISGWISYSYGETFERGLEPYSHPRDFDQKHTLSVVSRFPLFWNISLDLQYGYGSGFPWTAPLIDANGEVHRDDQGDIQFERINRSRYPSYERLDVRLSYQRVVFDELNLSAYVELINATNHKNVFEYYWSDDYATRFTAYMLPMLPFFGVSLGF